METKEKLEQEFKVMLENEKNELKTFDTQKARLKADFKKNLGAIRTERFKKAKELKQMENGFNMFMLKTVAKKGGRQKVPKPTIKETKQQ